MLKSRCVCAVDDVIDETYGVAAVFERMKKRYWYIVFISYVVQSTEWCSKRGEGRG